MVNDQDTWTLTDMRLPLFGGDEFPSYPVTTTAALERLLTRFSQDAPGIFVLRSPGGTAIRLGIGGSSGFVQCLIRESPHFEEVACTDCSPETDWVEFESEGIGEPFWPLNLLPRDEVIRIALDWVATGSLPRRVQWGERVWGDYVATPFDF